MTTRERFHAVCRGTPVDRIPRLEWATWWNKTVARWQGEGLPQALDNAGIKQYLGLDIDLQFWIGAPHRLAPDDYVRDIAGYEAATAACRKPSPTERLKPGLEDAARRQSQGDLVWISLDGFFWHPRKLLGIERHLYAFYDQPDLMHRINADLAEYNLRIIEEILRFFTPDFMTFGEDMSYNLGPMLSRDCFNEFLLPYYRRVIPKLKRHGVTVIVDTDGDLTDMVPWLIEAGIEGALPLERQAGVDLIALQERYPDFIWIGGFDKMTMFGPEDPEAVRAAMRGEFERLLPAMRRGRFIPSVDHQTPPSVSLSAYRDYLALLDEYAKKGARP